MSISLDVFVLSVTKLQKSGDCESSQRCCFNLIEFLKNVTNVATTVQVWTLETKKIKRPDSVSNVYKQARLRNVKHAVKTNRKLNTHSPFWETSRDGWSRFLFGNCRRAIAIKSLHYSSSEWIAGAVGKIKSIPCKQAGEAVHFVREIRSSKGDVGNPASKTIPAVFHAL